MISVTIGRIQLRRSFTPGYRPPSLAEGEPFLQLGDGKWIIGGLNGSTQIDVPFSGMGGPGGANYTLPAATASALGGIKTGAPGSGKFVTGFDTDGTALYATPANSGGGGGTATPVPKLKRQPYTPTNGQTVFTVTGGYAPGNLLVYVDGYLLPAGDVTATNGTTFTISGFALTTSDVVEAVQWVIEAAAAPTLAALTVSPANATVGTTYSGTVSGLTAGSTATLGGAGAAGLTISDSTITGTPTTAGPIDIVETLAGAANSPRTTSGAVTVAAGGVTPGPLSFFASLFFPPLS